MGTFMRASGKWKKRMGMVNKSFKMAISMRECGKRAKCMDKANILLTREMFMKESLEKT